MIQIQFGGTGILILEPKNLELLKEGKFLRAPIEQFRQPLSALIIDYTPDVPWVNDQITLLYHGKAPEDINPTAVQEIIRASKSRPEVLERSQHPMLNLLEKLPRQ